MFLYLQVVLVLIFMLGVILYRVLISIPLSRNDLLRPNAQSIASMTGAVVNLILIMSLGQVYQKLAGILNDWGMLILWKESHHQIVSFVTSRGPISMWKQWWNPTWNDKMGSVLKNIFSCTKLIAAVTSCFVLYWSNMMLTVMQMCTLFYLFYFLKITFFVLYLYFYFMLFFAPKLFIVKECVVWSNWLICVSNYQFWHRAPR